MNLIKRLECTKWKCQNNLYVLIYTLKIFPGYEIMGTDQLVCDKTNYNKPHEVPVCREIPKPSKNWN